jgi:hypothetical protein
MRKRSSIPESAPLTTKPVEASTLVATKKSKNPHAVALGRLGGLSGGKARAAKLSPEERSAIAKRAAEARWSQKRS